MTLKVVNGLSRWDNTDCLDFEVSFGFPKSQPADQDMTRTQDDSDDLSANKMITWVDPHTKLVYLINPRPYPVHLNVLTVLEAHFIAQRLI